MARDRRKEGVQMMKRDRAQMEEKAKMRGSVGGEGQKGDQMEQRWSDRKGGHF